MRGIKQKSSVAGATELFTKYSNSIHETATLRLYGVVSSATNMHILKLFSFIFACIWRQK